MELLEGNKYVTINDRYSHLKFKPMDSPNQLTIGMMVQVCENSSQQLSWGWVELTADNLIKLLSQPKDNFKWVRIPNY